MGFNNEGVDALVLHVQKSEYQGILGINIGKNKDTPLEKAKEDYVFCLRKVYPFASYIAINISSPNTPQLRLLHQEEYLEDLLQHLQEVSLSLAEKEKRLVPLLVKISPDEEEETIKRIAASVQKKGFAGIIASNTTSTRKGLENVPFAQEEGGLSGRPLLSASTHCIRLVREVVGDSLAIIGVGGIDNLPRAQEKREAGADLLQVYTGLIYQGPRLISILLQGQSLW
jgi:dihydroorotate dehydrogenase